VNLKNGSWRTEWADHDLTNSTTAKAGATVTVPVVAAVGDDIAFSKDCSLNYRAIANKSGTAK
jgi:hypothetical protein